MRRETFSSTTASSRYQVALPGLPIRACPDFRIGRRRCNHAERKYWCAAACEPVGGAGKDTLAGGASSTRPLRKRLTRATYFTEAACRGYPPPESGPARVPEPDAEQH